MALRVTQTIRHIIIIAIELQSIFLLHMNVDSNVDHDSSSCFDSPYSRPSQDPLLSWPPLCPQTKEKARGGHLWRKARAI